MALSIMAYGFGDMITRVLLIFISKWVDQLGVQKIYVFGIGVAVFSRFGKNTLLTLKKINCSIP